MTQRVTNQVDELDLEWVQAVLRSLIIPFDPGVARVEADVWDEWASNAPLDSTERLVLATAAHLAKTEQTSEARIPPALDTMGGDMLANPTGPAKLAATGVLEGYVQARQTVLLGPDDVPVGLSGSQEVETNYSRAVGRASAHRAVLLNAIEHHAANVPVWRWLARWYGSLSLAQGHTIEDLNTFGWGQVAFSLSIRIGVTNPFVREAWSVIDRMAAASVCYTKRSADFAIFTLMSLRSTGEAEPMRAPLPAPPGVMHSIPLTLGEIWDATKLFRSPDRAPEDVFKNPPKFHAYELELRAPDPTWAHMPSGRKALKEIHPNVPGKEKERHPRSRVTRSSRGVHEERESRFSVMAILDDPPRFGSPFLGEIAVRDEDRVTARLLKSLPPL